jgi:ATP-binding cassette subfamily F protein uup
MPLLTLAAAELAYGEWPLLDRAALSLDSGERIGLIGRNGSGKSSLLGVLAGRAQLDEGDLKRRDGLVIARVEQEPALPPGATLVEALLARAAAAGSAASGGAASNAPRMHKLEEYLQRFDLDPARPPDAMSGGELKRAALALAFALEAELLLLDEPTNHLDIDAIVQLEALLLREASRATIVVTHDRAFLDRVATRIVELDRGLLRSYPGNFAAYERLKANELAVEAVAARKFDKFWAQEEVWIRKGVEARRTRNEGRVRRLERLRTERAARREKTGSLKLSVGAGQRSGKLVAELIDVEKRYGERAIVKGLDLIVSRGDRLGLVGPNGAGKTTILKLILGTLEADGGKIRLGTNVVPAYFDQMRTQLDPDKTVAETISPGSDFVDLGSGTNAGRKHVMSYLSDFLFSPRRANSPVRMLSGGERNRLLLARLFARPANVLVLDEPTNDLDIESLELLEAALADYDGTLLLVSHDRAFLDNVVTQVLAPEGDGSWREYVGGYGDYLRQREPKKPRDSSPPFQGGVAARSADGVVRQKTKLSYKETRELASLPKEIEALEAEQKALHARMHGAEYYQQPGEILRADGARVAEIETLLIEKLERWEALEQKAKAAG